MKPDFSRRMARVMNSPFMVTKPIVFKQEFINKIKNKNSFKDLSKDDQKTVIAAEKSIIKGQNVWQ